MVNVYQQKYMQTMKGKEAKSRANSTYHEKNKEWANLSNAVRFAIRMHPDRTQKLLQRLADEAPARNRNLLERFLERFPNYKVNLS